MNVENDQKARWNGPAGQIWVENRDLLDTMFRPFEAMLTGAVRPGDRVLDVGCGTGATTLALARAVGAAGAATGLDLSEPMIATARERAAAEGSAARFLAADAATHAFAPPRFDALVSRFGVMFFPDPVAAFANLRAACRPDAGATLVAWRTPEANPFMTAAEEAAAPFLDLPPRKPGPGQFAFGDAAHVRGILDRAGWQAIDLAPIDVACTFPAADLDRYVTRMGPLGIALRALPEAERMRVNAAILAAYVPFVAGDAVRFTAACWSIRARA